MLFLEREISALFGVHCVKIKIKMNLIFFVMQAYPVFTKYFFFILVIQETSVVFFF